MSLSKEAKAMLATIVWAEGTNAGGRDPYRVVFGYGVTLKNLTNHPAVTGEWRGKFLPPTYCRRAGLRAGCKSTAAGAYQITKGTWLDPQLRRFYTPSSFSPSEQDNFCWYAICKSAGVCKKLENGDLVGAIKAASSRWASLPGSSAGQPKKSLGTAVAMYERILESLS